VRDFTWSPNDHVIAYWTPESGNIPARVTLMKLTERQILRTKNLFNVVDVRRVFYTLFYFITFFTGF